MLDVDALRSEAPSLGDPLALLMPDVVELADHRAYTRLALRAAGLPHDDDNVDRVLASRWWRLSDEAHDRLDREMRKRARARVRTR